MLKRLKERNKERWFKIRRFFYRRQRLAYRLRWTRAIILRVFATSFILLWVMCIGVGITGILNKFLLKVTIPMKVWTWFPIGLLSVMGVLGGVILVVAGIELIGDHLKDMKRKIRRSHSYFNYDMEYEIEDRAVEQRMKDRQVEEAELTKPKWEV